MRTFMGTAILLLALGACARGSAGTAQTEERGRYVGLGVYAAGPNWSRMTVAASSSPGAAGLKDDEEILALLDSRTGEVRQCGALSGICIAMNPWASAVLTDRRAPVPLMPATR
jgi:hypothetical protein